MAQGLTFALPKGRILKQAMPLLAAAGIDLQNALDQAGRRLQLQTSTGHRALLVKPSDVPTYVEYGVADLGIAGGDTLDEQARDLYEPVDLQIGRCRLVVAQYAAAPVAMVRGAILRVATKYPRLARQHYQKKGIAAEIIPLSGSVELGALTGLADQIVDLVESGETLRQNRLEEVETVMHVTSRLIVHPASLKLRSKEIASFVERVREAVQHGVATQEPQRKAALAR